MGTPEDVAAEEYFTPPEQNINAKLAEWAGFFYDEGAEYVGGGGNNDRLMHGLWFAPDNSRVGAPQPPPFTGSLDACFKWLVPKLDADNKRLRITSNIQGGCVVDMVRTTNGTKVANAWRELPARAVCVVIEMAIESEGSIGDGK